MKRILGELPKEEVSQCLGRKVFQIGRAGKVTKQPPTVWSHREWTRDYCNPDCRKPVISRGPCIPLSPCVLRYGLLPSHNLRAAKLSHPREGVIAEEEAGVADGWVIQWMVLFLLSQC